MIKISHQTNIVLIADDEPAQRLLLQSVVEQLGLQVVLAENGVEAVECFKRYDPDLVLLDIKMPLMDGLQASEAIRRDKNGQHVPIVLITGSDDHESIRRAFDLGVTDFITKPVIWPILSHRLRYLLKASATIIDLISSERRLINTQMLAAIGHWEWDFKTGKVELSEQMYGLLNLSVSDFNGSSEAFFDLLTGDDRRRLIDAIDTAKSISGSLEIDHMINLQGGGARVVHQQGEIVYDEHGEACSLRGLMQDITKRKIAEEKVRHLAYYDSLTGLPNRLHFIENAELNIQLALKSVDKVALIFMDIDDFKRINDSLGHHAGDILLQKVSHRLVEELREYDSVSKVSSESSIENSSQLISRLGGDEFTIMLTNLTSRTEVQSVCERLVKSLNRPIEVTGTELVVSGSFGIAIFPEDGKDLQTLMRHADIAMYQAKKVGKNNLCFYNEKLDNSKFKRLALESKLRHAIENELIEIYFQAQIDGETGLLNGAEVLARWHDAELGVIPPDEFIPLAENCGLIIALGDWVLKQSCRQAKRWQDEGHKPIRIAVNVSVQQFRQRDFAKKVLNCLNEAGLAANYLELEITESMLVDNLDKVIEDLNRLKAIGVRISIDDFGTGYSSMSYLKLLPVDKLKIDRSFISGLTEQDSDGAIVKAIIALSQGLQLNIIAEGVETAEQRDFIVENGCKNIQGFFYSKPLEPMAFEQSFLVGKRCWNNSAE
ncbi:MAG: EAL domain-containing protein [Colwellia sp.]